MIVSEGFAGRTDEVIQVFRAAFAASEGADEGEVIAGLVRSIFDLTSDKDLRVFCAETDGGLDGVVAFTRLTFPEDDQNVMLLSPMAVSPTRQKRGVGQALIREALSVLRSGGVDVAITYGDHEYYRWTGFLEISEADASAPMPLGMPHGWLGQRLDGGGKPSLKGPSSCVAAFRQSELW